MKLKQKMAIWYSKREKAIDKMVYNIKDKRLWGEFCHYCDNSKIRRFKDKLNHFCKVHNLPVITIK